MTPVEPDELELEELEELELEECEELELDADDELEIDELDEELEEREADELIELELEDELELEEEPPEPPLPSPPPQAARAARTLRHTSAAGQNRCIFRYPLRRDFRRQIVHCQFLLPHLRLSPITDASKPVGLRGAVARGAAACGARVGARGATLDRW